jgi:hypothetical protein
MEAALRKFEYLSSPVYWDLLSILPDSRDFYPLVLNIHDPNAYFDFLNGNLILIVIFDNAIIESKFVERGFACEFIQDPQSDYYLRISQENGFAPMEVSRNFVGRVAFEFLSLSWMVDELVSQYYYAMEKLKNMELCEGRVSASRTDARLN